MDTLRSQSGPSSDDSYEDDEMKDAGTLSEPSSHLDPDKNPNQDPDQDRDEEPDKVPDKESSPSATNSVTSTIKSPVKKRRRVTRACDECRRKKIKCDGTQPCIHCTVYSYGQYPIDDAEVRPAQFSPDPTIDMIAQTAPMTSHQIVDAT